jgi:hypothetical protein
MREHLHYTDEVLPANNHADVSNHSALKKKKSIYIFRNGRRTRFEGDVEAQL